LKKLAVNILKIIFFLGLGVFIIWLVVKDKSQADIDKIKNSIRQANYYWIALSCALSLFSHYFRAIRWKILLVPLGHQPKTQTTFFAVMIGYFANLGIPRSGEVARCGVLNTYEGVPFTEGFGSVIAERAFDLICLILIFFIAFVAQFDKIYGIADILVFTPLSGISSKLLQQKLVVTSALLVLLIISGFLFYLRKKIQTMISGKVLNFINGLWQGLLSIKKIRQPVIFLVYTMSIWLMYILQVYVCFFAFPETTHLSFLVAMVITAFGSIAIILIPGGTGLYQAIVIQILITAYFIVDQYAEAFAWTVWVSQIIMIIAAGLLSLVLLPLLNTPVNKKKEVY
jgi:uncharacterized protein (TIRG00374 family)